MDKLINLKKVLMLKSLFVVTTQEYINLDLFKDFGQNLGLVVASHGRAKAVILEIMMELHNTSILNFV